MAKEPPRFEVVHSEGAIYKTQILRDTETGVNYLWRTEGYGAGLTPLLNAVGGVVITGLPERR
ncbi:DUF6440 family protein [Propioniciclava tarda]|uniref:DUF6440 domain-containing protein n=1 Tax=Propioniciclava tarda TaxID=433330 RepID=A0A4Q9KMF8_PROTD|nr:DUF6440 family protein [Propioniciclava tarda]TBT94929.1 hypothetical protein ET996_07900 [Propioniciclava tarda]SMO58189.1 hypothetical protein SAMN06266982_10788 [Propioniciclava tarda]HOA89857.1 DUF6440 family protein [Propioniciclava tarda]HQA31976.1 DUF6440 family protein [Propioniciclava tarda]HQD61690.1 DUF6440 family protein [Propioniciclava tarda]